MTEQLAKGIWEYSILAAIFWSVSITEIGVWLAAMLYVNSLFFFMIWLYERAKT